MALLSLIVFIVSLFIGRGKGLALYGAWMVLAWFVEGMPTALPAPGTAPIFLASCAVTFLAIMVQRWAGLIVSLVGTVAIVALALFGLL